VPRALRILLGLLVVAGAVALVAPGLPLAPVAGLVQGMGDPGAAPRLARLLGILALLGGAGGLAAGAHLLRGLGRLLAWVAALPPRAFLALAALCTLAPRVALRLAGAPLPVSDAAWYLEAAASLARGEGFAVAGQPTAYRMPGYPALLALSSHLPGASGTLPWAVGLMATLVMLAALHRLGRRLHGEGVARLAVLGAALYPALVVQTGLALSELAFLAGAVLLACLLVEGRAHAPGRVVAAGALAGLLILLRGAGVAWLPLVPLSQALRDRRPRRVLASALLAGLAAAAVLAPWLVRNRARFGRPLLTTSLGLNLAIGNHPGASGGYGPPPPLAAPAPAPVPASGEADLDARHRDQALAFLADSPLQAAALLPRKLVHLFLLETSAVTALTQGGSVLKAPLLVLCQAAWMALAGLLLLRLAGLGRTGEGPLGIRLLPPLVAGAFSALSLVFFGDDRFRMAFLPFLLLEGAVVLEALALGSWNPSASSPSPSADDA
jgi:4-amino-4-deoxy-L-arabinose transferase-like glycosyltransferase